MKSSATANPALHESAFSRLNDPQGFAGLSLFPIHRTANVSADYYVWNESAKTNTPSKLQRAPSTGFARTQMELSSKAFGCREYGHEEPVSKAEQRRYFKPEEALKVSAKRGAGILLAQHDTRAQAQAVSAGVPTAPVGAKWDNLILEYDSDPVGDVETARKSISDNIGLPANVMVVSQAIYEVMKVHPKIKARMTFTGPESRWPALLAGLFDVERFVVATGQYGPHVLQTIWGNHVYLARVDFTGDLQAPSFGRTFLHDEGNDLQGVLVEQYPQPELNADVVRVIQATDEKLCAPLAGFVIQDVI